MVGHNSVQETRTAGRIIAIAGVVVLGLVLLMVVSPVASSSGSEDGLPEGWQTILFEKFDTGIGSSWLVTDTSTTDGGEYYWGVSTYTATSPITAAWSVGGGADGINLTAGTDAYTNNVDSWLVFGPVTLTRVFGAEFTFDWWLDSAPGDWFSWCLMTESVDLDAGCTGASISGHIGTWVSGTVPLEAYSGTPTPLYLAFHFTSNDDGLSGEGAFVDNILLQGDYGRHTFLPMGRLDPTPTPAIYLDEFDDPGSGWYTGWAYRSAEQPTPGLQAVAHMSYYSGRYRMYIPLDYRGGGDVDTWFVWPAVQAPLGHQTSDHYVIEVRGNFAGAAPYQPWWAHWGIVFAANGNFTNIYTFQINTHGNWAVLRYPTYHFPGSRALDGETEIEPWLNSQHINLASESNTLRVVVDGNKARYYINDVAHGSTWISGLQNLVKVGLIGGSWEVTPVDVRIDYFSYQSLE